MIFSDSGYVLQLFLKELQKKKIKKLEHFVEQMSVSNLKCNSENNEKQPKLTI